MIFNGNGYDPAEQERLTKMGVWRIDSGVEAICRLTAPKNIELFGSLGVLSQVSLDLACVGSLMRLWDMHRYGV